MRKWLRRIRAAVVVGPTWGIGWGLVGFLVMEPSQLGQRVLQKLFSPRGS